MNQMCRILAMYVCDLCEGTVVVVFSTETAEAPTMGLKRSPDEGTPSTKERDVEEGMYCSLGI